MMGEFQQVPSNRGRISGKMFILFRLSFSITDISLEMISLYAPRT